MNNYFDDNKFNSDAKQLFLELKKFRKMMRKADYLENLNANEIMVCSIVLKNIEETGQLVQVKTISEKMGISRPAVNTILNRLEDKKLIERLRLKDDRKSVYVNLTKKAFDSYDTERDKIIKRMNNIVLKLGKEDTLLFIELLEKLYNIMEEEVK